ncbi:MAG: TetR/AcrR family transcriptional regulator [Rhodoglobus sp.]
MPRVGLTTERVVDEAERLADEVGFTHLSLSNLAARLGVQPPSLYKHIAGQDALQRTIESRAKAELAEVMRDAAVGRSGPDRRRCRRGQRAGDRRASRRTVGLWPDGR